MDDVEQRGSNSSTSMTKFGDGAVLLATRTDLWLLMPSEFTIRAISGYHWLAYKAKRVRRHCVTGSKCHTAYRTADIESIGVKQRPKLVYRLVQVPHSSNPFSPAPSPVAATVALTHSAQPRFNVYDQR